MNQELFVSDHLTSSDLQHSLGIFVGEMMESRVCLFFILLSLSPTFLLAEEEQRSIEDYDTDQEFDKRSFNSRSGKISSTTSSSILFPTFYPTIPNRSSLNEHALTVKSSLKKIPLDFLRKLSIEQDITKVIKKYVSNVELKEVKGQVYLVGVDGKPVDSGVAVLMLSSLNATKSSEGILRRPSSTTPRPIETTKKAIIAGHAHKFFTNKITTSLPSLTTVAKNSKLASLSMATPEPYSVESDLFVRFGNNNQDSLTKRIADPAICKPELKTVEVPIPSQDLNAVYLPLCVRVERCGGCCISDQLVCEPIGPMRPVYVQVSKFMYSNEIDAQGAPLKHVSTQEVIVEEHTKCHCNCKIKAEHCNSKQWYDSSECQCVCNNETVMENCKRHRHKIWDHSDCACKCRDEQECNTGFQFDPESCQCKSLEKRHRRQHEQQRRKNKRNERSP